MTDDDDETHDAAGDDARCPHLDYRTAAGDRQFDVPRAYCTVVEGFVEPMRADVCNRRYGLAPATDCEIYREAEAE